ncbi:hypothetical protein [Kitasatospora sp. NPDC059571]|uniref:hypothetical protein n=1 Tax=Kitasatospora sp. NPDC059571 TaxID=3346871 RepID=UPI0036817D87
MDEQRTPQTAPAAGPAPEPIRWFGTGWVEHDGGYRLRRVLVPIGALLCTLAGALLLRFAVAGVGMSDAGGFVNVLLVAAIAICTCLSAMRMWKVLTEGRDSLSGWMAEDRSLGAVWLIGGVGALAVYFFRSLVEAPGEAVHRAAYEQAVQRHERRRAERGGRRRR